MLGATPVFVDVDADTFNLDAQSLKSAIATAKARGLKPKAVIPVDLFGLPADHDAIAEVVGGGEAVHSRRCRAGLRRHLQGPPIGTFGHATATSFFPAKPLGCYGDGGAVLTDDDELLAILKSVRVHGGGSDKYDNVRLGLTARLDTIQAAVLIEKLKIFREEIEARNRIAQRYSEALAGRRDRAGGARGLRLGLGAIHHPAEARSARRLRRARCRPKASRPRSIMPSRCTGRRPIAISRSAQAGLAVSERLADEVISLPMHAYLDEPTQDRIVDAVRRALR